MKVTCSKPIDSFTPFTISMQVQSKDEAMRLYATFDTTASARALPDCPSTDIRMILKKRAGFTGTRATSLTAMESYRQLLENNR